MATPRIIYIAGHARSGSTVLDQLLDSRPDTAGLGELAHLPGAIEADRPCTCGERLQSCAVWSPVVREHRRLGGTDLIEVLQGAEFSRRPSFSSAQREGDPEWARYWGSLLPVIAESRGCSTLVDSSKSLVEFRRRELLLRRLGLDVLTVWLIRSPLGVAASARRGPGAAWSARWRPENAGLRSLVGFALSHTQVVLGVAATRHRPVVVRNRSLRDRPARVIAQIETQRAEADLEAFGPSSVRERVAGHAVGGNELRHG